MRLLPLALTAGAVLAVASLGPSAACAQPAPLDARARAAVIDSLAGQLQRHYVDADTARHIGDHLRARLRAGAYDTVTYAARFAELVTRDLREVNGDLHLSLRLQPPRGGAPAPGGPSDAARQNFGMGKAEILPGNVGYLEITGFAGAPGVEDAVASALRFLERTDALIVDVRRNGGGSGQMSHLVFSHFLASAPVPTIRVVTRATGRVDTLRSLAVVPGPRRTEVPLYVLTSRGTASAAEEFTSVLKNLGRATVVGDRTAGAGHMVRTVDVGHGFVAGVSYTRVLDARSGREWERDGVQPDLRVAPERALDAAHSAALRKLAGVATTDDPRRRTLDLLAEMLDARQSATRADAGRLAALAGTYDGDREVLVQNGALWFRGRAGVLPEELVPLRDGRWALGATRLSFETGATPRLVVERPDGTRLTYARSVRN